MLRVLENPNDPELVYPYFSQTKTKTDQAVFPSDFRNLNKQSKCRPYTITKIIFLLKLESLKYTISISLNMGYYHIQIFEDTSKFCTIIIPWVKYHYKFLPMGVSNSPDILKMNELLQGFEFIRVYLNKILIIIKRGWKYHLQKLE